MWQSKEHKLSSSKLKEILEYNSISGVFIWKLSPSRNVKAGDIAGSSDSNSYTVIGIEEHNYLAHRLAWLYVTGEWPTGHIDHINGCPHDNRMINLRNGSRDMNMQNQRGASSNNKTGFLGVIPNGKFFQAKIRVGGKNKHLGTYSTPEEAHQVYLAAKRQLHPGCTI